jgi:chromosome segregation ATPase
VGWFSKKKEEEPKKEESSDESSEESENKPAVSGNIEAELTKIKSSLDALNEVRKANAEQFTRVSEQIGELRGGLMDTNKAVGTIEVAATKAIDLVSSVQPDKLMIEVRKIDGKVEALRASLEANETIMKDIMKEMKDMRSQMNFYKGVDQVVKMNNEIKQELIDIKKTEGLVGKHADRVETIFVEVEKKFYDFEKFNEAVKELDRAFKKINTDFDKMRVGVDEKADKKEFVKMVDKFTDFEKHTTNIMKLLDQKSKNTITELNNSFTDLKKQLEKKYDKKLEVKPLSVEDKPAGDSKDASKPAETKLSENKSEEKK